MSTEHHTTLIIGAGQSGIQVADSLRSEGYLGQITLLSDELPLPYQRPQLSKDFLSGDSGDPATEALPLRSPEFFTENNIELRCGARVRGVDTQARRVTLSSGEQLYYSDLVIATGTRARRLSVPGADLQGIHRVRTLDDSLRLREELRNARKLVVVGAGFIGLEVAAMSRKLGVEVTVLPGEAAPMARSVSPEVSRWFEDFHRGEGVHIACGESALAFEGEGERVSRVLSSAGNVFAADVVLVGIGAVPNVEVLEGSGIAVDNGVLVDASLRTSAAGVWALGDCAALPGSEPGSNIRIESVQNATDQGRMLARNLLAALRAEPLEEYRTLPWFWSHQGRAKLQIAGLRPAHCTEAVVLGDPVAGKYSVLCFDEFDELVAVESLNSPGDHMAARKILSQQIPLNRAVAETAHFTLKAHSRAALLTA